MTWFEYPKALYRDGVECTVTDKDSEAEWREKGFMDWLDDHTKLPPIPEAIKPQETTVTQIKRPTLKLAQ